MSRLGCRTVSQSEDASFSYALLPCLVGGDGCESARASPQTISYHTSGNLYDMHCILAAYAYSNNTFLQRQQVNMHVHLMSHRPGNLPYLFV